MPVSKRLPIISGSRISRTSKSQRARRKGVKRPGPWQDLPHRHGDDNNVNLGTNVGFVSGLQATRTRVQEMIFRAEKDRFFHAFLNQLERSALT